MKKERITIAGDRYLIYYSFDDENLSHPEAKEERDLEPRRRPERSD